MRSLVPIRKRRTLSLFRSLYQGFLVIFSLGCAGCDLSLGSLLFNTFRIALVPPFHFLSGADFLLGGLLDTFDQLVIGILAGSQQQGEQTNDQQHDDGVEPCHGGSVAIALLLGAGEHGGLDQIDNGVIVVVGDEHHGVHSVEEDHALQVGQGDLPEAFPAGAAVDLGSFVHGLVDLLQTGQEDQDLHTGIPQNGDHVLEQLRNGLCDHGRQHTADGGGYSLGVDGGDTAGTLLGQHAEDGTADDDHRQEEDQPEEASALDVLVEHHGDDQRKDHDDGGGDDCGQNVVHQLYRELGIGQQNLGEVAVTDEGENLT